MLSIFSRESVSRAVDLLRSRFPIPTLIAIILTLYLGYQIWIDSPWNPDEPRVMAVATSLILTFFLSVAATLWIESRSKAKRVQLVHILPIVYGVVYYLTFSYSNWWGVEDMTFFLLHLVGFVALIFCVPFFAQIWKGREYAVEYSNYFSRASWVILMSAIVGVMSLILGYIAIYAVGTLFDLRGNGYDKLYGYWMVLSLALLAQFYGLSQFPREADIDDKKYENNRFFAFIVKYILVPFVFVYFAILYAYSIKVLMSFGEWPKGVVTWLVIGFSTLGYLTYIYSKPYEGEGKYIALFRKLFPYAVVPQIGMLGYAIYLRIAQYGFTINRYFIVVFGLWLILISIHLIVSRKKSLITIPLVLALMSLIISVGPWSVFAYPLQDQSHRLMADLDTAGILDGNLVTPKKKGEIPRELSGRIYNRIQYLCRYNDCATIKEIFHAQIPAMETRERTLWESSEWNRDKPWPGLQSYQIAQGVSDAIGVESTYVYSEKEPKYIDYTVSSDKMYPQGGIYPLDTRGYDQVVNIAPTMPGMGTMIPPYLLYDVSKRELSYMTASGVQEKFVLELPASLSGQMTTGPNLRQLSQSDLTFFLTGSTVEMKVIFQTLSVPNPKYTPDPDDHWIVGGVSGIGLVRSRR